MVKLNRDDIIGLGCVNADPDNDELYTYKVCIEVGYFQISI